MNNWKQFLSLQETPASVRPGPLGVAELANGFVAPLSNLGLIAVSGADGASFLHNQLSNDVMHLGEHEARLAAYCSPKGRMLASFLIWRTSTAIYLQLPLMLQVSIQKRLAMFVMRAKATLTDVTDSHVLFGLGGAKASDLLQTWFPDLPPTPYSTQDGPMGTLIRVADAFGAARYQWLCAPDTAQTVWLALSAGLATGHEQAWELSQIHAGIPQITLATQDRFVPQMVNFELLGGVNFKKGCYPGQEIVARSQYLGKLKRRTTLVTIPDAMASAGDEVFASDDPSQPCGMVVNACANGVGAVDALVEMKLSAIEQAAVRLGSADGAALQLLTMPYALDALDL